MTEDSRQTAQVSKEEGKERKEQDSPDPEKPKVSAKYNDKEADLTLISSDGVTFKLELGWLKSVS